MKTVTDFLHVVLDQSQQALKKNEIPVGAVIYDPKKMTLISKAHNKELSSKDPTSHAEILCIRKACKKLNQKRLDGLIMITYLEPCNMCKEVIKSARIKEVRFIFSNQNPSRKTIKKIIYQKLETNEENLVKTFFKKKELKISTNIFSIVFLIPLYFFSNLINFISTFLIGTTYSYKR